jgi:hypothetical protein
MTYNGLGPSSAAAEDGARGDQLEGVISHQDNAAAVANQAGPSDIAAAARDGAAP